MILQRGGGGSNLYYFLVACFINVAVPCQTFFMPLLSN